MAPAERRDHAAHGPHAKCAILRRLRADDPVKGGTHICQHAKRDGAVCNAACAGDGGTHAVNCGADGGTMRRHIVARDALKGLLKGLAKSVINEQTVLKCHRGA